MRQSRLLALPVVCLALAGFSLGWQARTSRQPARSTFSTASLLPPDVSYFVEIQDPSALREGMARSAAVSRALTAAGKDEARTQRSLLEALRLGLPSRQKLSGTHLVLAGSSDADGTRRQEVMFALAPDSATARAIEPKLQEWYEAWFRPSVPAGQPATAGGADGTPGERGKVSRGVTKSVAYVGDAALASAVTQRVESPALPSLAQQPLFLDAKQRIGRREQIFAFFNRDQLNRIVRNGLDSLNPEAASVGRTAVDFVSLEGVEAIALGTSYGSAGATDHFHVYRSAQSDSLLSVAFKVENSPVEVFDYATRKATTAVEYHFDYTALFDQLLDLFGPLFALQAGAESAREALHQYESKLGFKIREELLPALGSGLAVVMEPPLSASTPASSESVVDGVREHGVLLLPVRDRKRFAAVFERVRLYLNRSADRPPATLKPASEYRGVQIISERGAAMAFLGGQFAIAREPNLKRLIDARADRSTLVSLPELKAGAGVFAGSVFLDASHGQTAVRDFVSRLTAIPAERIDAAKISQRPFLLLNVTRHESGLSGAASSPVGVLGFLLASLQRTK